MATDPVRFKRLARVRALQSFRRKRRFTVVAILAVMLTAISGVGSTTVRETSLERREPRRVETPLSPHPADVAPPMMAPAPMTIGPLLEAEDTRAGRADTAAAARRAQKGAPGGLGPKRNGAGAMPDRQVPETATRTPAGSSAGEADPAAVIEWLLERSRASKP